MRAADHERLAIPQNSESGRLETVRIHSKSQLADYLAIAVIVDEKRIAKFLWDVQVRIFQNLSC